MNQVFDIIKLHGTKALGFLGATLGVLAVADPSLVGGDRAIKYYLLGISLLTTWRGFFTSDAFKAGLVAKAETTAKANDIIAAQKQQGGFARLAFLIIVVLLSVGTLATVSIVSGCTSTRAAYKEASGVDETAYVVAEHYSALVKQAADLKEKSSTSPQLVAKMQEIDQVANPAVHKIRELRDAYLASKSAATQTQLQDALDDAAKAVADLSRIIKQAVGGGQ